MHILLLLLSMVSAYAAVPEQDVRDYLMSNPEVVWEALELHKYKLTQSKLRDIARSEGSQVVVANSRGKNELIMFIDYRCGACRRVYPWVEAFAASHKNVKIVMKPYPVLGTESIQAALMLYDSVKGGDAEELHRALIDENKSFSVDRLKGLAKEYRLKIHLPSTFKNHWAFSLLEENHADSVALENQSVPFFIMAVDDKYKVLRGISSKEELGQTYNQML